MDVDELTEKLAKADIAFGRVNDPESLRHHPHLRRITIGSPTGPVSYPAPAALRSGEPRQYGPIPALGEHSEKIRKEFGGVGWVAAPRETQHRPRASARLGLARARARRPYGMTPPKFAGDTTATPIGQSPPPATARA